MTNISTDDLQTKLDAVNESLNKLNDSHEKYMAIFEYSNDAIFLVDPETDEILEANTKACELLGYSINELLKLPMSAVHSDEIAKLMEFASRVISDGSGWTNELSCTTKWAKVIPAEISASTVTINGKLLLISMIRDISERKISEAALNEVNSTLEDQVLERTKQLENSNIKLAKTIDGTINAICKIVELRDPYTAGHQQRVANLAREIAREMNLSALQIEGLYMTGKIHDVGKIYVPAEILAKPGKLSDREFALIKEHAELGAKIMWEVDFPWPVSQVILQHHERMDGSGYPNGLMGDEIRIESRVMGVADVVEAMSSFRPYRPELGIDAALEEINQNAGVLYDQDIVDACTVLLKEKSFDFTS